MPNAKVLSEKQAIVAALADRQYYISKEDFYRSNYDGAFH